MVELRRRLHRLAEPSGGEARTAESLREVLLALEPDRLMEGLGGHGLAAVFVGGSGRCVLVRSELDAIPVPEPYGRPDASETSGFSHKCGHDGHMAISAGLAASLSDRRTALGSVVILFQPAEETGAGARLVLDEEALRDLRPDVAFALHNVPGFPLGSVLLRDHVFASTARSLRVDLEGRTSHAAEPERGLSPAAAVAEMLTAWPAVPSDVVAPGEFALVTVVHAKLGEPALGTSPGLATLIATLRAQRADVMERLSARCEAVAHDVAREHGLEVSAQWLEEFPCTVNDPAANALVEGAARELGLEVVRLPEPFRWTEDFGHFTEAFGGALFGLGAGEGAPPLHHPDYTFPDELVGMGADLLRSIVDLATEPVRGR